MRHTSGTVRTPSILAALVSIGLIGGAVGAGAAERVSPRQREASGLRLSAGAGSPMGGPVPSNWLMAFNYYRDMANLPHVTESVEIDADETWSQGGWLHSRWMVKNQIIQHGEGVGTPFYTLAGHRAGVSGNILLSGNFYLTSREAIEGWITAPFHAIGMLDPYLSTTGYGEFAEMGDTYRFGATVDVGRGRDASPGPGTWPIMFPGHDTTVHLDRYPGGEQPDPLDGDTCEGYEQYLPNGQPKPTGLPVYLMLDQEEEYLSSTFKRGDTELPHCAYDDDGYTGSEPGDQGMGPRNAIFLIPKNVLTSEKRFHVSITTDGGPDANQTYEWSFWTGDTKAPTSKVTKPAESAMLDQDRFEKMLGTASADTEVVHVAIGGTKGTQAFQCRFLKADGSLTSMRSCEDQVWLKATGKANWARKLNGKLPPTYHPSKGQIYDLKYYYSFSRATDEAGNVEKEPEYTGKYHAFFVTP